MKILIIEDEKELALSITQYFQSENYLCETANSYRSAIQKINLYEYDCILLDIGLPDGSGLKILESLKVKDKQEGVIIISAKDSLNDKIKALQIGADDYLTKPFHLSELAARVFSLIRRKNFNNLNIVTQGKLEVDLLARTLRYNNQAILLTKKEFDLLIYFIGNKNRVLSKNILAEHLSGDFADMLDNHNFVYTHIKNLKRKLQEANCPSYIETIYGTGYKWIEK